MKLSIWLTVYPWATESMQPPGYFASIYPPTAAALGREGERVYRVEVEVGDPIPVLEGTIAEELPAHPTKETKP